MATSTILSVILVLPALIAAQSCDYEGSTYANLAIIDHTNGCAKLQCQKGTIVATYEACGKDVDGECHFLGSQFLFNNVFYRCVKRIIRKLPVYNIEAMAPANPPVCTAEGTQYNSLEKFTLSDGCRTNQCQSGTVVVLNPKACGKNLDGSCHYVNSWALKNEKVFTCQENVVNGRTVYEYSQLNPQPDQCGSCTFENKKHSILEQFNSADGCNTYQCQDGQAVQLTQVCRFPSDGKCYTLNTQWKYGDKVYECVKNPDGSLVPKVVPPTFRPCILASKFYDHLQTIVAENGCQVSQCLNGRFVVIHTACSDRRGICRPLNTIWTDGSDVFQCAHKEPWGVGINRIIDDALVPVCEKPGKDIIYLLDDSGSIRKENFEKQKKFTASFTRRFFVGTNASNADFEFGAVSFSTDVKKQFDLNTYLTQSSVYSALLNVPYTAGWTYTDLGFDYIVNNNMFDKGRSDAGDFVILLTDGNSTAPDRTLASAKRLRGRNVQIIAVGIAAANKAELNAITDNPNYVFHVDNFDALNQIEEIVSHRVCTAQTF